MQLQAPWNEAAIRDTIDKVFRSRDYSVSWQDVVIANVIAVVQSIESALRRAARDHPVLFWSAVVVLFLVVGAVLARGYFLARRRAELLATLGSGGRMHGGKRRDPWKYAQELAARGQYSEAAHALYSYLLDWMAARESVELHPSKTIGDYARDLRMRSSRILSRYREFARNYEVVVYGSVVCDRDRYERLLTLASAITGSDD